MPATCPLTPSVHYKNRNKDLQLLLSKSLVILKLQWRRTSIKQSLRRAEHKLATLRAQDFKIRYFLIWETFPLQNRQKHSLTTIYCDLHILGAAQTLVTRHWWNLKNTPLTFNQKSGIPELSFWFTTVHQTKLSVKLYPFQMRSRNNQMVLKWSTLLAWSQRLLAHCFCGFFSRSMYKSDWLCY